MKGGPFLVVSASAGAGHVRAADAVCRAFAAKGLPAEHVDVLELTPRWVRGVYGGGFRLLAEHAPRVWHGIYQLADGPEGDAARWGPIAQRLVFRAFRRLLASNSWQYCLCTHFLPAQLASRSCAASLGIVITDYTLHRVWVQPRVSEYFVANESLARALRRRLHHADVVPTGIPVDPVFAMTDRMAARQSLALDDEMAILVMGGGFGLGIEQTASAALRASGPGVRVLAVCGDNMEAKTALDRVALFDPRLVVFGYVNDIHRLMCASDVVITKPGGLSTSEALALGRPLILTRPIPGHEEANTRFLVDAGAAVVAFDPAAVEAAVHEMILHPDRMALRAAASALLGRPAAAASIAGALAARRNARTAA
jgi:processive 1,2-diacylglycerol beta-glucosyltransferase